MANPVNNTQNNKCPHGFPTGTCPICNGMSGSSRPKDRNKPRVAGEMSYNECLAEWIRMQKANQAKIQDKLDKIENIHNKDLKEKLNNKLISIQNKIDAYFNKLDNKIQKLPLPVKIVVLPAIKIISTVIKVAINITFNVSNFIVSVCEKMAMLLSEVKNHISQFVQKTIDKTKKAIKTILSLFMEFEEDEDNSDKQKIKEIVKKAINKVRKKEKENEFI